MIRDKKRKLLFVNRFFDPDASATSQILTDLSRNLVSSGVPVVVVTSRLLYDDPDVRLASFENQAGVEVHRVPSTRFGRSAALGRLLDYVTFAAFAAIAVYRLAREGDVVIAKTDPPMLGVLLRFPAVLRGSRFVQWLQDLFPEIALEAHMRGVSGVLFRLLRSARDASLRDSDIVISISDHMRTRVLRSGADPAQVAVAYNWALEDIQPVPRQQNALVTAWNLQNRFVLGYSGNMGRAHEFETVVEAGKLLREDEHIVFLWIGGGAWRAKLEELAREQGLRNWVFKPYQPREDLHQSLSVPDVHLTTLLPSMEGLVFPSKLYGILAAGRPTLFVGAPDGEVATLLARFECGVTVPVGRPDLLADTVRRLARAPDTLTAMGLAARRAHEQYFAREIAIARWRAAVEPILGFRESEIEEV